MLLTPKIRSRKSALFSVLATEWLYATERKWYGSDLQGSYRSWKSLENIWEIFKALKTLENDHRYGKIFDKLSGRK